MSTDTNFNNNIHNNERGIDLCRMAVNKYSSHGNQNDLTESNENLSARTDEEIVQINSSSLTSLHCHKALQASPSSNSGILTQSKSYQTGLNQFSSMQMQDSNPFSNGGGGGGNMSDTSSLCDERYHPMMSDDSTSSFYAAFVSSNGSTASGNRQGQFVSGSPPGTPPATPPSSNQQQSTSTAYFHHDSPKKSHSKADSMLNYNQQPKSAQQLNSAVDLMSKINLSPHQSQISKSMSESQSLSMMQQQHQHHVNNMSTPKAASSGLSNLDYDPFNEYMGFDKMMLAAAQNGDSKSIFDNCNEGTKQQRLACLNNMDPDFIAQALAAAQVLANSTNSGGNGYHHQSKPQNVASDKSSASRSLLESIELLNLKFNQKQAMQVQQQLQQQAEPTNSTQQNLHSLLAAAAEVAQSGLNSNDSYKRQSTGGISNVYQNSVSGSASSSPANSNRLLTQSSLRGGDAISQSVDVSRYNSNSSANPRNLRAESPISHISMNQNSISNNNSSISTSTSGYNLNSNSSFTGNDRSHMQRDYDQLQQHQEQQQSRNNQSNQQQNSSNQLSNSYYDDDDVFSSSNTNQNYQGNNSFSGSQQQHQHQQNSNNTFNSNNPLAGLDAHTLAQLAQLRQLLGNSTNSMLDMNDLNQLSISKQQQQQNLTQSQAQMLKQRHSSFMNGSNGSAQQQSQTSQSNISQRLNGLGAGNNSSNIAALTSATSNIASLLNSSSGMMQNHQNQQQSFNQSQGSGGSSDASIKRRINSITAAYNLNANSPISQVAAAAAAANASLYAGSSTHSNLALHHSIGPNAAHLLQNSSLASSARLNSSTSSSAAASVLGNNSSLTHAHQQQLNLQGQSNSHNFPNGQSNNFSSIINTPPPSNGSQSLFSALSLSGSGGLNNPLLSNGKPLRSERLPSPMVDEIIKQAKLRRRNGGKKEVCVFCRNNGEKELIYTSHTLKDASNSVACPILRLYQCPICHASGDLAHTIKYCPYAEKDSSCTKLFKENGRMSAAAAYLMNSLAGNSSPPSSSSPPDTPSPLGQHQLSQFQQLQQHQHHSMQNNFSPTISSPNTASTSALLAQALNFGNYGQNQQANNYSQNSNLNGSANRCSDLSSLTMNLSQAQSVFMNSNSGGRDSVSNNRDSVSHWTNNSLL